MKTAASILIFAALLAGCAHQKRSVVYPISKQALELICYTYPEGKIEAEELSAKNPQAFVDFTASSHVFFKNYGIDLGHDGSFLAYDGHALLIGETKENHAKISLILQVAEDMVRSTENKKRIGSTAITLSADDESRLLCYMLSGQRNQARSFLSDIKKEEIRSDAEADAVLNKFPDDYLSESTKRTWAGLEKKRIPVLMVFDGLSMQEIAARLNLLGQGEFEFKVVDSLKEFVVKNFRVQDSNLKQIVMLISDCTGGSVFALPDGKVLFLPPNHRE